MKPCTKEQLLAALQAVEDLEALEGVSLYFIATGTGGCDGPPSVVILERNGSIPKATIDADRNLVERHNTRHFHMTGICILAKKQVEIQLGRGSTNPWTDLKPIYCKYTDYENIETLAKTIVGHVLKTYNITIV